jgi:C1A family cysteine protease
VGGGVREVRALGYKRDKPDARDRHFAAHPLAASPVPVFGSVESPLVDAKDQQQCSGCVGMSESQGVRLAWLKAGKACPELSALAVYRGARNIDGTDEDGGTYLRSGMKAIVDIGIPPEVAWPFSMDRVPKQLDFTAYSAGFDLHGARAYYRIAAGDLDGIARAVAAGWPVVAGWDVSEAFCSSNGKGIFGKQTAPIAGGHAICITAFGTRDKLITEFHDPIVPSPEHRLWRLINSWGSGWGYGGRFYVTDAFIAGATDVWALEVAP